MLRPFDIYQGGVLDQYLAGFMNQVSQAVDDAVTAEVHSFKELLKKTCSSFKASRVSRALNS